MAKEQHSQFHAVLCTERQSPHVVDELYRLRKTLFVDLLGWKLTVKNGRERDQFDTDNTVYCALFRNGGLIGGFRAIRTDHDYLVRSIFPQLAAIKSFPQRRDIWEISRFGVLPVGDRLEIAKLNYALMFWFASQRQATALVALVDLTYERFLKRLSIRTRRYGPPQIVGTKTTGEPIWCVAGEIPLAEQSGSRFHALLALATQVDIKDETPALGRIRVSA